MARQVYFLRFSQKQFAICFSRHNSDPFKPLSQKDKDRMLKFIKINADLNVFDLNLKILTAW